jgi:hypothetical protein
VSAFCESKGITDVDNFIYLCFKQGFDIRKYGLLGKTLNDGEKDLKTGSIEEKQVIKEIIVEKRVEIPVEVIKEVEKIVEVIKEVEKIVEVPVEKVVTKIEYISDKSGENELLLKIQQLENEMSKQNVGDDRAALFQQTIQKLNEEIRELKIKNKELEKKLSEQPKDTGLLNARFHGSSNLNS